MSGIFTNNPHHAFAADDLAFLTTWFCTRVNFHDLSLTFNITDFVSVGNAAF